MADDLVCIYVSGDNAISDFDRDFGWRILEAKLAVDVDLLERSSLTIKDGGKRKHSSTGRGLAIFTQKSNIEEIFARLRAVDPNARAYAVPILASL